jgi:hypothetical protein
VKFACGQLNKESTQGSVLALVDVWVCIQGLTLDQLCIHGVRPRRDGCIWKISEVSIQIDFNPLVVFHLFTSSVAGGSGFSFSLKDRAGNYGGTLETLGTLIGLLSPSTLRHFSFNVSTKTRESKLWSLQAIQRLLNDQRDSLKSIAIDTITTNDSPVTSLLCLSGIFEN